MRIIEVESSKPARSRGPGNTIWKREIKQPGLLAAIKQQGFGTIRNFCSKADLHPTMIYRLAIGELSPWTDRGWTRLANDVATALDALPEDIFQAEPDTDFPDREPAPDPHEAVVTAKRNEALRALIDQLPGQQRAVMQRHLDGEKSVDISRELRVSVSNVSMLLQAALESLRKRIAKSTTMQDLLA